MSCEPRPSLSAATRSVAGQSGKRGLGLLLFLTVSMLWALPGCYHTGARSAASHPAAGVAGATSPAPTAAESPTPSVPENSLEPASSEPAVDAPVRRAPQVAKVTHGPRSRHWVALTIDDGPHPGYTPRLLATLKQYKVKATFFVVGEMADRYPELVQQEIADGHSIGTHTYTHANLRMLSESQVQKEIKEGGASVKRFTGSTPTLLRPPFGFYNSYVVHAANALGYTLVLWSLHSGDSQGFKPDRIMKRVHGVKDGDILLMHDGYGYTPKVLPRVLEYLKSRGFEFVTVSEMLRQMPPEVSRSVPGPAAAKEKP
jgi:peptidoglycan/xylan/chitin deacetylase (PgdA/CDA1 family)